MVDKVAIRFLCIRGWRSEESEKRKWKQGGEFSLSSHPCLWPRKSLVSKQSKNYKCFWSFLKITWTFEWFQFLVKKKEAYSPFIKKLIYTFCIETKVVHAKVAADHLGDMILLNASKCKEKLVWQVQRKLSGQILALFVNKGTALVLER